MDMLKHKISRSRELEELSKKMEERKDGEEMEMRTRTMCNM